MKTDKIAFEVAGIEVIGTLRVPEDEKSPAAILVAGPMTSVKEQAAGAYAEALARRGFITLAIDHRHYGESGGQPRQYEHPQRKIEDLRAAVKWLRSRPELADSAIAVVGVCAGAGYAAWAVTDAPGVAGFATVAGYFRDAEATRASLGDDAYQAGMARAIAQRERFESTGETEMIPAVGKQGEVAMPLEEAFDYYGTSRGAVPGYVNSYAIMSKEHSLPFDVPSAAPDISAPTLMVHSESALAPAWARKFFAGLAGPADQLWLESPGQMAFYDDPQLIEPASDALAGHFRATIGATT